MSEIAAFLRDDAKIVSLTAKIEKLLRDGFTAPDMPTYLRDRDMLISAKALLISIHGTMSVAGSRGGAVYYKDGNILTENKIYRSKRAVYKDGKIFFIDCRPVPSPDNNFEKMLKG